MAVAGWLLDKSAVTRAGIEPFAQQLDDLAGMLCLCPVGELEQLYSARSADHYDDLKARLHGSLSIVMPPDDIFERALRLQRDLARYHGLWHRLPIPDLLIAETALHHRLGVVHVDGDYDRSPRCGPWRLGGLGNDTLRRPLWPYDGQGRTS